MAVLCRQRRGWEQAQHRIETGQQSARRVDVEGFGSKVRITFSKEGPSSDQVLSSLTLHHASLHVQYNIYVIAYAAA
jgi:hypothetical protein